MGGRLNRYLGRIRDELRTAFSQEHTSREVAGSFALGVFITMLPTLGTGLLIFVVLSYLFARINKVALFASVLVLNPPVKWGVYGSSITLGIFLLGPVEGVSTVENAVSLDAGWNVLVRLWVGNLILAVLATAIAYPLAYRTITTYRDRELALLDRTVETVSEGFSSETEPATDDETTQTEPATDAE